MGIKENIEYLNRLIERAAVVSGRKREDIKLVAVTKTVCAEVVKEAIGLGMNCIGENRVQEVMDKYGKLRGFPVEWHFIGHLQRNKVKYIIDKAHLIHSVDSVALAEEISKRAGRIGRTMNILIQVNVSGEESKFGLPVEGVVGFIERIKDLNHISIMGLMTIAPYTADPEEARPVFARLKDIYDRVKAMDLQGVRMDYLSMGMTGDFTVAIEEGANIVRIGTGIFGERRL